MAISLARIAHIRECRQNSFNQKTELSLAWSKAEYAAALMAIVFTPSLPKKDIASSILVILLRGSHAQLAMLITLALNEGSLLTI